MQPSSKLINVLLVVLVAAVLAICVLSIRSGMHHGETKVNTEYAGNK